MKYQAQSVISSYRLKKKHVNFTREFLLFRISKKRCENRRFLAAR